MPEALARSQRVALFSDLEQLCSHGRSAGNCYGAKYYATNRLTQPAAEVRRLYRVRAQIEEVIRVYRDQLGLTGCQARSERGRLHHIACCLVAFCVLERQRHTRGLRSRLEISFTIYE